MSETLSEQQWQLISAALDGELVLEDKKRLDSWIQNNKSVQQAYQSLQQVKRLVQTLPPKPIPHSFILTREMAGLKPNRSRILFPTFSVVSALAAFLLAAVFLFGGPKTPVENSAFEALASRQMVSSPVAETADKTTPDLIFWGSPALEKGGSGGGNGAAIDQAFSAQEAAIPAEAPAAPTPEAYAAVRSSEAEPITGAGPILGVQSPAPAATPASQPAAGMAEAASEPPNPQSVAPKDSTGIKIGLAGLSITSALAAFYFWRKSRTG